MGLLVEMIRDSQGWNLQEQYLLICVFILLFYRIVSFFTVYISLPRYSYSKNVKQSAQQNNNTDIGLDDLENNNGTTITDNNTNDNKLNGRRNSVTSTEILQQQSGRSCLSYCWLQFFFDFGYVMELAPWLWNWEQTKIILPEFAWFSKVYILYIYIYSLFVYTQNRIKNSDENIITIISFCNINGCIIISN